MSFILELIKLSLRRLLWAKNNYIEPSNLLTSIEFHSQVVEPFIPHVEDLHATLQVNASIIKLILKATT